jgi:deoxyribonuclease V
MILAIDVYYADEYVKAVGVTFNWGDKAPLETLIEFRNGAENYVPGEFYKRELPLIIAILEKVSFKDIEAIIIDGYVYLDHKKPGLGYKLWLHLNRAIPIIGIAKTSFQGNDESVIKVTRGESKNPLYVSSVGIKNMYGEFRIPTILKELDKLTKI